MSEPNYITPRGAELFRRELEWLQTSERPMIVREVSWAASLGDRSENAEYIYGKKRLREIDGRMRYIMGRLGHLIIVDPAVMSGPTVRFSATIDVEDEEGNEKTWHIYGEDEVDVERGILSHKSPLARAFIGKEAGDTASFMAPGGRRELVLLDVRYEPQEPILEEDSWETLRQRYGRR